MANLSEAELYNILASNPSLAKRNPQLQFIGNAANVVKPKKIEKPAKDDEAKPEKKSNKYKNTKWYEYEDGFCSKSISEPHHGKIVEKFDSEKEMKRWHQLQLLEKAGAISDLKRQVKFVLQEGFRHNGEAIRPITYTADFVYRNNVSKKDILEDVKGYSKQNGKYIKAKEFDLKWKMMKYRYPEYDYCLY